MIYIYIYINVFGFHEYVFPYQEVRNYINWFDTNTYSTPTTHNNNNNGMNLNLITIAATIESPSVVNYGGTYPCLLVPAFAGGSLLSSQSTHTNNNNLSTI